MTDDADALSDLTLAEVMAEAADGLDGVNADVAEGHTEWAAGPSVFATLDADRAEFRLDPGIAAAALRTPDTAPSPRGGDWIAFAPPVLDDHAVDRAEAWFLSAHRRAAASRGR
ncbi:MAG TPA: hypothetical protein VFY18_02120 [Candidatus Limnocylindrales bacterium]|nr:hypothetical protein [Candidatus Limnocylindrales bacterium]